jgi:UDP-glucose 4-epimerase
VKWLVTGGCGFIGTNLVLHLLAKGEQVCVVDNLSSAGIYPELSMLNRVSIDDLDLSSSTRALLLVGDIQDENFLIKAGSGFDIIVHLAASTGVMPSIASPRNDCWVNVFGTLNALESARINKVHTFVFASSGAPLGNQKPPIHEEMVARPLSPYGASKLSGEAYCSAYHASFGIRTMVLRFSNVYGPFSLHKQSVIAKFILQALKGEKLIVYGDGSQTRDFIHVDDLTGAILSAVYNGHGGDVYQIASQKETSVSRIVGLIVDEIQALTGRSVKTEFQDFRKGEILNTYADISKAKAALKWTPRRDLISGIRDLVQWFTNSNRLNCP